MPMRAAIHFRLKGVFFYRNLGSQEINVLPDVGGSVTVDVDGKPTQATVIRLQEVAARTHELSLYLEGV